MASAANLRVVLAGRVAIESERGAIADDRFPGRQGRMLFAYFVLEAGRPVPRDELAEALWGETPPRTWDKALTNLVSRLRALLSSAGVDGNVALTTAFGCYRLELPAGTWVDVTAAVDALGRADEALTAGDVEGARAEAALVESLLRHSFLPGEDAAWVLEKRRHLGDVRGSALEILAESCLRAGDGDGAVGWAEEALALAPFREASYRRLMLAHMAGGDRAEALRVYDRCRRLLAEELGAYPSPETDAVYRRLLENRPGAVAVADVPPPAPVAPDAPQPVTARSGIGKRRAAAALAGAAAAAAIALGIAVALTTRGGKSIAVAAPAADSVAVIDAATGKQAGAIAVGSSPTAVAVGAGSAWIAEGDGHSVARIDPRGRAVTDSLQVGHAPAGLAVADGFVWVANSEDGTVTKLDPRTQTAADTIRVGSEPTAVATRGDEVWVANGGDGTLTEVDATRDRVIRTLTVGRSADGLAIGFGAVWVTSSVDDTVTRVELGSWSMTRVAVGSGAEAVATGAAAVWVANRLDGTVSRIDPDTDTVRATIPVGDGPDGVVYARGHLWVSNEFDGTVSRIDPRRDAVVEMVKTGGRPTGIARVSRLLLVTLRASAAAHSGGTLTVLLPKDTVPTIDPAVVYNPEMTQLAVLTNDGLTGYRRTGGTDGTRLVPDLAVSLPAPTDAGRTYTFKLRPGIHYSNGRLVRPADFQRAIERSLVLTPADLWSRIVGAASCRAHPQRKCTLSRGIVPDARTDTVTFHLTAPDPSFLHELAQPAAFAVPASTPLHPHTPVPATGPYRFAWFDPARGVRLVRNRWFHEWSAAAQPRGFPNTIVERFTGSADQRVATVLRGAADLAVDLSVQKPSAAAMRTIRTQHASELEQRPWATTWFIVLNTRVPPFDDVRARRALNYAINRARLRNLTLGPRVGHLTCQILPPDMEGYVRYCPYTAGSSTTGAWRGPNLARGQELVRASGTTGQRVTFWIPRWIQFGPPAGRYVVSVLHSLGYKATYRIATDPYTREDRLGLQAGFYAWSASYPSPASFIGDGLSCASFDQGQANNENTAEFCDPTIDRELAHATALEANGAQAASQLWARIDRQLTDQAPWVPFANGVVLELKSTRVGNYQYNEQWGTLLDQLWVR